MITQTIEQITPYERAVILYNKYTKEYNRTLCMGTMQQTEHWQEVTRELAKLYKR
jgi:hypothetical protein